MLSAAILAARSTVREKKNWQIHLNYVKQVAVHPRTTQACCQHCSSRTHYRTRLVCRIL
jgi:hypothetical protein